MLKGWYPAGRALGQQGRPRHPDCEEPVSSFPERRARLVADKLYELRNSNDAQNDSEELRRRLADEGYLFFRRLIEPSTLVALRAPARSCTSSSSRASLFN